MKPNFIFYNALCDYMWTDTDSGLVRCTARNDWPISSCRNCPLRYCIISVKDPYKSDYCVQSTAGLWLKTKLDEMKGSNYGSDLCM